MVPETVFQIKHRQSPSFGNEDLGSWNTTMIVAYDDIPLMAGCS